MQTEDRESIPSICIAACMQPVIPMQVTGSIKQKGFDFFFLKGVVEKIIQAAGCR
jgi:hypothetical protein